MNGTNEAWKTARLWQPLVCLGLLASIALSIVAMEITLRDEGLAVRVDREFAAANDGPNLYRRLYLDNEDRALLSELEELDVSRGGVYFFGGSNMMWATRVPDLPPAQRRLVHNFAVGGESSPRFVRQYVEFLVNHKDLLHAGDDKTLVVYGTCFLNVRPVRDNAGSVFTNMWRRRGLYRYDFETGIEPVPLNDLLRRYIVRKGRYASLVQGCFERFERWMVPKALRRRKTPNDAGSFAADYRRRLGPQWREYLAEHRAELQQLAEYIKRKKMNFAVVLLPLASWHRPLPYPPTYRAMIEDFCKKNGVPLYDLSTIAGDDDFIDHIHMNERGLPKTDAALMEIARNFLQKTEAWPDK